MKRNLIAFLFVIALLLFLGLAALGFSAPPPAQRGPQISFPSRVSSAPVNPPGKAALSPSAKGRQITDAEQITLLPGGASLSGVPITIPWLRQVALNNALTAQIHRHAGDTLEAAIRQERANTYTQLADGLELGVLVYPTP